jgi:hypothetical protein
MEKERNRNLMLYEFKCGHSAAAATRNICRIEGAGTVKEPTCRQWFVKFLNREEGFKNKNCSKQAYKELGLYDSHCKKYKPISPILKAQIPYHIL